MDPTSNVHGFTCLEVALKSILTKITVLYNHNLNIDLNYSTEKNKKTKCVHNQEYLKTCSCKSLVW